MLQPRKTKFRKYQKGRIGGIVSNTDILRFGQFGIKALEPARIQAKTIEAIRRVMTRKFKRTGIIWIRIFPDIAVSSKPAEVRMGKGKGSPDYWICRIKKGQILFEMDGINLSLAQQAARLASYKFPGKIKFVTLW
ncbi:50S ribosomal protein L16 [Paenibacillus sp. MAHUQ-46]|uniref:Large ribosomal subunit protein uL16 n=1 Tax=Paenibacillus roseus TaxID=2798579 RepID=A0A934J397_9BACL|nr:50S ribosomal protein L16 [Paenibacillus roseus]MBJ6361995.1 50S ribosomal protein L16 [Paenibacillus roseus]